MTTTLTHTWYMTVRHVRAIVRQPWYVALTLIQPIIWLLLFGALFKKIVEIPGFASTSYITFLTPGIVVMSAVFSGGWGGMGVIDDLNRGVMDRFLVAPVSRSSVLMGRVIQTGLAAILQSLIMVGLALAVGAHFPGGVAGLLVLIVAAILLSMGFGSLSNGLALLLRREESVIAASNFILLPLTFLSSAFLQQDLAPHWIQVIAAYNPVNWAIEAGRGALGANVDWTMVLSHLGYLLAFMVVCAWLSTRAFRSYQRSV
jgi:ABC-2 type transport system permease protein